MKTGTSKLLKCIPVHQICFLLPASQKKALLAFHELTGCDSVSQFAGHGKKTQWKIFKEHYELGMG